MTLRGKAVQGGTARRWNSRRPLDPDLRTQGRNHEQHNFTNGGAVMSPATEDPRVISAREYLRHIRTGPRPGALPRAAVDREAAELRKLLGQVLDAVTEMEFTLADAEDMEDWLDTTHIDAGGGVWLTPADALVFAQALPEAIEHAGGEVRAGAYAALARALGIEVRP